MKTVISAFNYRWRICYRFVRNRPSLYVDVDNYNAHC